jgi:hypothetical protein
MVLSGVFLLGGPFTISGGSVTGACTDYSGVIHSLVQGSAAALLSKGTILSGRFMGYQVMRLL